MAELTREQKLERIALLEEKHRRNLTQRPSYKPNSGQLPIHTSKFKHRFVFSANGAGKTALLVHEMHWAATGFNPITNERTAVPAKIILVIDKSRKIAESILPEWRKWFNLRDDQLKKGGTPNVNQIIFDNGSTVSVYSAESDPISFEGVQSSHVFIDEPLPRNLYVALRRSLRMKNTPGRMLFCGTAVSEAWLRRDIYIPWTKGEMPDAECFKVGARVNEANFPENYLEEFSRAMTAEEKEVRIEGGFFDAGSLALAHLFNRATHILQPEVLNWNESWPVVVGIDPHPVKKHVAVMVGATPDSRQVVLKEISLKKTAKEFGLELVKWMAGYRVVEIVCDSLGATQGTGNEGFLTFIEQVNKVLAENYGKLRVRSTRYEDKSHEDLVDRLQSGLLIPNKPDNFGKLIPNLRVAAECKGVIENIESVGWQKNAAERSSTPKLDTASKDFLSACGYALSCNIHFQRGREKIIRKTKALYRGISLPSQRRSN